MWLGNWQIDDVLTFPANTHNVSTGAAADADAVPAYRIYEDETGTAILTGNTAKLDDANTVGFYTEQITLSAANGFENGKTYTIYLSAAVSSVTGTQSHTFSVGVLQRANVVQISDDSTAADNAESFFDGTGYAGTGNVIPTVTTLTGHTAQTGDSFARLGAPAGASVSADIADVPTVAEFNARTLVAASYFDPAADTVANVTTVATLTGHTAQTGDSFARLGAPAGASVSADIATVDGNVDTLITNVPDVISQANINAEVDTAIETYGLDHLVSASVTGTDITDNSIIAKLVSKEATADWDDFVNTTESLQALRDHIADGTNLTEAGGTGDHLTALATASALSTAQADLDTITDTGVTAVALTSAAITDVWSTDALTESYATDGSAGTAAQLLYLILSACSEFSISGTTLTCKKLDGSTTAATYTLNDATSPTSRTRAT